MTDASSVRSLRSSMRPWLMRLGAAIAMAVYPIVRALTATLTWRIEGAEHWDAVVRSGRQPNPSSDRIYPTRTRFRGGQMSVREGWRGRFFEDFEVAF